LATLRITLFLDDKGPTRLRRVKVRVTNFIGR
jgi:hypothetical protein